MESLLSPNHENESHPLPRAFHIQPRFVTGWHMSADERPETIYDWNGKLFEQKK
jgi:hypothetical protein